MPYFQFKIGEHVQFRTQLQSLQCTDVTKKGTQCKRKCVIGSPWCSTHLSYKHHLKIKTSLIPNAGKGLFACDPLSSDANEVLFKKGATICKYFGEVIDRDTLIERYSDKTGPFVIGISNNRFEDGAKTRGVGSLANTNPHHQNASISVYNGRASLKATKNIKNGDEVYLSYGREYKLNQPGVEATTTKK